MKKEFEFIVKTYCLGTIVSIDHVQIGTNLNYQSDYFSIKYCRNNFIEYLTRKHTYSFQKSGEFLYDNVNHLMISLNVIPFEFVPFCFFKKLNLNIADYCLIINEKINVFPINYITTDDYIMITSPTTMKIERNDECIIVTMKKFGITKVISES